jgi:hypothetical protein
MEAIIFAAIAVLAVAAFFIWFGKKIGMSDLEMAVIYLSIGALILIPRMIF